MKKKAVSGMKRSGGINEGKEAVAMEAMEAIDTRALSELEKGARGRPCGQYLYHQGLDSRTKESSMIAYEMAKP